MVDEKPLFVDDLLIDLGVTSGSDPTGWDPISVDRLPVVRGNPNEDKATGNK